MRLALLALFAGFLLILTRNLQASDEGLSSRKLNRAVVQLTSTLPGGERQLIGTAFFIDDQGTLLTAYHLVEGVEKIKLLSPWYPKLAELPVTVSAYDEQADLAKLSISLPQEANLGHLQLADSVPMALSKRDGWAIGHPYANLHLTFKVSFPEDAAKPSEEFTGPGRTGIERIFAPDGIDFIRVKTLLDGGMSGGPVLVNEKVIAIISGSLGLSGEELGWAVPISRIRSLKEFAGAPKDLPTSKLLRPAFEFSVRGTVQYLNKSKRLEKFRKPLEEYWREYLNTAKDVHAIRVLEHVEDERDGLGDKIHERRMELGRAVLKAIKRWHKLEEDIYEVVIPLRTWVKDERVSLSPEEKQKLQAVVTLFERTQKRAEVLEKAREEAEDAFKKAGECLVALVAVGEQERKRPVRDEDALRRNNVEVLRAQRRLAVIRRNLMEQELIKGDELLIVADILARAKGYD